MGIRIGFGLTQCRVICPEIHVFEDTPDDDYKALIRLANWALRYSPACSLQANDPYYSLLIDITGAAHLMDGEQNVLNDIINKFKLINIEAKAACADNSTSAWAFAFYNKNAREGLILKGDIKDKIDILPISALRLEKTTQEQLYSLGLTRIGQLKSLPIKSLVKRFGAYLVRAINRIYGDEIEVINPVKEIVPDIIVHHLNYSILNHECLELETNIAIDKFCSFMKKSNRGAKKIRICFFRVDGFTFEISAISANSNFNPKIWKQLIKYRLETVENKIDYGFGIDQINIYIELCEIIKPQTTSLDENHSNKLQTEENINRLIERLSSKIGSENVSRFRLIDDYVPERAHKKQPAISNNTNSNIAIFKEKIIQQNRPLFLLKQPQEIDVIAEVPDGAPLRFIYRKRTYNVKSATSPERIVEPLNHRNTKFIPINSKQLRDYYTIETDKGLRFFVFRRGLYGSATSPKWYIHGAG